MFVFMDPNIPLKKVHFASKKWAASAYNFHFVLHCFLLLKRDFHLHSSLFWSDKFAFALNKWFICLKKWNSILMVRKKRERVFLCFTLPPNNKEKGRRTKEIKQNSWLKRNKVGYPNLKLESKGLKRMTNKQSKIVNPLKGILKKETKIKEQLKSWKERERERERERKRKRKRKKGRVGG